MMVDEDDGSKPKVLRSSQDLYMHDTNFSDLPDLPQSSKDDVDLRAHFTNLNNLFCMSKTMKYDEKL